MATRYKSDKTSLVHTATMAWLGVLILAACEGCGGGSAVSERTVGELQASGVISDDEFAAQKAKLLA